jgi:hypothetical protein
VVPSIGKKADFSAKKEKNMAKREPKKKETPKNRKVSASDLAEMSGQPEEDVEKAEINSTKVATEDGDSSQEFFHFETDDEVKQALDEGKLRIHQGALWRNTGDLANEGKIQVENRREKDKRVVRITMDVAKMAFARYQAWLDEQPADEGEALKEFRSMVRRIDGYESRNPGLDLEKDKLLKPIKGEYQRIKLRRESEDYRSVIRMLADVRAQIETKTKNFLSSRVTGLLEQVQAIEGFDPDLLNVIEGRIEDAGNLEDENEQRQAYAAIVNDLRAVQALEDPVEDKFNTPRRRGGREDRGGPRFDRRRGSRRRERRRDRR